MYRIIIGVLLLISLAGCASDGIAVDSIARVYFQEFDGCVDGNGYSGWSIQLKNDHPNENSRSSYQIPDSLVEKADYYAQTGERVRIYFEGSNFDSDCDKVVEIAPLNLVESNNSSVY